MKENNFFLNIPNLGDLYFDEIYVFYDNPQVFTCRDKYYHAFLFTYASFDETTDTWIACPVSEAKISLLKSRRISVYDALANNEDGSGKVHKIVFDSSTSIVKSELIDFSSIPDDQLPDRDYYINYKVNDLPELSIEDLSNAKGERRDIFIVSFEDQNHTKEINANVLATMLSCIQNVVTCFSSKLDISARRIPPSILDRTQLSVTGYRAASFAIVFKSYDIANIMNETPITDSIKHFIDFIELEDSENKIKDYLRGKSSLIPYHMLRFYNNLSKNNLGCGIYAAYANGGIYKAIITNNSLPRRISNLSCIIENQKIVRDLIGKFIMVNMSTNKFTFLVSSEEKEYIQGKIGDSASREITTDKECRITVEETELIDDISGEIKKQYLLLSHNFEVE